LPHQLMITKSMNLNTFAFRYKTGILINRTQLKTTVTKSYTLLEYLYEQYPDSPKTRVKKLLQSGIIRINNKPVTLNSYPIKPGDTIEINQHELKASKVAVPFPVLFDDQHIIVIEKPAGISTSSTDGSKNVQEILSEFLKKQSNGKTRSYVVHRLDKEVSGVLLFAKEKDIMESIKDRWEETEKHYFALVEGVPEKTEGTIESWLIEDKSQKVHSTTERPNAKFSVTNYKQIRQVNNYMLLDIKTDTGRKNQIRVHLSDIGCPIVGDRKYGASDDFIRRVRLHACSLKFPHPVTGKTITVESSLPKGFLSVKEGDEHYK
jgi:23S rRNA pseudouridine1911/1915/1917 synthase